MSERLPRLSLCVIARDEEANLPRCLGSVEGLVDEVIVTDTGSTDRTVEVAVRAGAKVETFTWCDDFSAAYNHGLDRAAGEWVLVLDADEELAPGCQDDVRRLTDRGDAFGYTLMRQDYRGPEVREGGFSEMLQTRLWRNDPRVRYTGRIHQQFRVPLEELAAAEGKQVFGTSVRLKHYGYVGSDNEAKLRRSARLLALELQDRPGRFYYLVELALTQLALRDERGLETLHRAAGQVADGSEPVHANSGSLALLLEKVLAFPTLPARFPLTHQRAEQIAREVFPTSVPLLWQLAQRSFRENRFAESARLLEKVLELAREGSYCRLCSFDPRIMGGDASLNLAVCYAKMGRIPQAAKVFEELRLDPLYKDRAEANLQAIKRLPRRR